MLDTSRQPDYEWRMTTAQERKQQERQARRRRIQRAAREVFAEKGYAKTSIEQVARQASLSVGAIYLYFRSKEDLYVSLLEETFEVFDVELSQLRARADLRPDQRLHAAWSYLTQWAVSDVEGTRILRLISQPGIRKQLSDEVAESASRGLGSIREHLASLVEDAATAGVYRAGSGAEAAELLWALFLGVMQASDARANLELSGTSFSEAARLAFGTIEATLRTAPARVAEAA
jgi:AcrR family transcriptional regulator